MISKRPNPTSPKSINNPSSIHHQSIQHSAKNSPKVWPSGIRFLLGDEIHIFLRLIAEFLGALEGPSHGLATGKHPSEPGNQRLLGIKMSPQLYHLSMSLFIDIYQCINIYRYLSIFINGYQWLSMVINGYQWLSMFINVYQCLSFISVLQQSKIISRTPWLMLFLDSSSDS
jgi:hypothetical protein